jgi:hypothetical protein
MYIQYFEDHTAPHAYRQVSPSSYSEPIRVDASAKAAIFVLSAASTLAYL